MGNLLTMAAAMTMEDFIDARYTMNYTEDGGCGQEYMRAFRECHPWEARRRQDGADADAAGISNEECARATMALLKCMKLRPEHFHAYIARIEGGLDQDQQPRPEKASSETPASREDGDDFLYSHRFRWWEGMRRS